MEQRVLGGDGEEEIHASSKQLDQVTVRPPLALLQCDWLLPEVSLSAETPGLLVLRKSVVCFTSFRKCGRKSILHYQRCPELLLGWGW